VVVVVVIVVVVRVIVVFVIGNLVFLRVGGAVLKRGELDEGLPGSDGFHHLPVEVGVIGVGCAAAVDFILGVVHCQELRLVAVVSCVQRRRDKNARPMIQHRCSRGVAATAQHPSGSPVGGTRGQWSHGRRAHEVGLSRRPSTRATSAIG